MSSPALFGQIAVRFKYATPDQVREALERQEKYLAAHVQKPIGEIMKEMGLLSDRRIARILRAQGFRRERSASKEVARMAVEEKMATQAQVDECLSLQETRFRETKKIPALAELLFEKGIIGRTQQRSLLRAQRRMERGQSDRHTTIAYAVKECANCFENVALSAERCPHCGNGFGAIDLAVPCPRCGAPQTDGSEFCAKCGANLVTGVAAAQPVVAGRCPGCGRIMSPDQRVCFQCGYLRPLPIARRAGRAVGDFAAYVWGAGKPVIALVAVIALVLVSVRYWKKLRETSTDLAFGESESSLRARIDELAKALLYKDVRRVRTRMVSNPAGMADGELLSALVGAGGVPVEVVQSRVADVLPGEKDASVYLEFDLKVTEEPPAHEKTGNPWGDLEVALGQSLSKGKQFTKRLTWRFTRVGDEWKLEAP